MQQTTSTLRFAVLITLASGFLDAYTYPIRGGVFANVQTANVIFMGIELSDRRWTDSLQHLWPILAFALGAVTVAHIKSGRSSRPATGVGHRVATRHYSWVT